MRLSELLNEQPVEESSEELDLSQLEKTAELLESLSEEDTLMDDLAKLAILQDIGKPGMEKIGYRLFGLGSRSSRQVANQAEKAVKKSKETQEILVSTARTKLDVKKLKDKEEKILAQLDDTGGSPILESVLPAAIGAGAGIAGTGYVYKKREDKMVKDLQSYLAEQQTKR